MNQNLNNSDFMPKQEDEESLTSRGINYTTRNILSARSTKSIVSTVDNKGNISFSSRSSSRNNFVKCPTERGTHSKEKQKNINDIIQRNFNLIHGEKKNKTLENKKKNNSTSILDNINQINNVKSINNNLKEKTKEQYSRNQRPIFLKGVNGKELSFGILSNDDVNSNNNENKKNVLDINNNKKITNEAQILKDQLFSYKK